MNSFRDLSFLFFEWPSDNTYQNGNFLKVFEKVDVKLVLVPTNMIIAQLNIKDYEYDHGVSIFCYWGNI